MKWWTRRTRSLHSLAEEDGLSIINNINRISSGRKECSNRNERKVRDRGWPPSDEAGFAGMTREGLPGQVTFTLAPKREKERLWEQLKNQFSRQKAQRVRRRDQVWGSGKLRAESAGLRCVELRNQGEEFRFHSQRVGNHRGV